MVAVGYSGSVAAGTAQSVIARYNPDGTPDYSFGYYGTVVSKIGNHQSQANDVAVQANGQIVVVGDLDMNYGYNQTTQVALKDGSEGYVYRYNGDGSLDPTLEKKIVLAGYGASGTPQDPYGYLLHLNRVFVMPNGPFGGDIMVFGPGARYSLAGSLPDTNYSEVYRFNPNGTADTTFGQKGAETILPTVNSGDLLTSNAAFGADGSFYIPGQTHMPGAPWDFALYEFDSTGKLKASPPIDFAGRNDFATAAAVQADNSVVVVGYGYAGGNTASGDFEICRIDPSGSLDTAFGTGGKVTIDFGGNDVADDVLIEPDGGILISGHSTVGANTAPVAVLLTSKGVIDTSFGVGGKFIGTFSPMASYKNNDLRFLLAHAPLANPNLSTSSSNSSSGQLSVTNSALHPGGSDWGNQGHNQSQDVTLGGPFAPTASLYYSQPVNVGGYGFSLFQVHFNDKQRIDLGSLGNQNLVITGPNGYSMNASYFGTFGGTTTNDVFAFYGFYPPGGSWDSGDNGVYTITLQAGKVSNGHNFAVTATVGFLSVNIKGATISGVIFDDLNGNGSRQAGESPLVNRYVYIDLNHSGNYASNDPLALSDINGHFSFNGLAAGTYIVRTYLPPGWKQTTSPNALVFSLAGNTNPVQDVGELPLVPGPKQLAASPLELPASTLTSERPSVSDAAIGDLVKDVLGVK